MKKVFSFLAIAMVAIAAFAFNSPNKGAFAVIYSFQDGQWIASPGPSCPGAAAPCEYTASVPIHSSQRQSAANQLVGSGTQNVTVDADNDGQVDDVVEITNIKRFN